MPSKKTWVRIGLVYDHVHLALWASLIAFLVYFGVVVVPHIPAAQARFQRHRIEEIRAEHEFYCNKWGMLAPSRAHAQCLLDLQAFRAQVEKRIYDENDIW